MNGALARRSVPVALAVAFGCGGSVAQQGFQHVIPGDALAFIGVDSVDALSAGYASSPIGRLWDDPELAPLRREIAAHVQEWSDKARAELGADPFELPGMLQGPFAIALLDVPGPEGAVEDGGEGEVPTPFAVCLLADVGSRREDCRALVNKLTDRLVSEAGLTDTTERMGTDDVRVLVAPGCDEMAPVEFCQTFHGNVLVLTVRLGGPARDDMRRLIDGLDGRTGGTLAGNPSFVASLAGNPGGPNRQRLWVDVQGILDRVLERASASGDLDPEESTLLETLGVRDLGALSISSDCVGDGSHFALRLDWSGAGWIPRLAQKLCQPGDFRLLRYVPADCRAVEALRADFGGLFDSVVKMLIDGQMMSASDVVNGLAQAEEWVGFNPRDDLLDVLDGECVLVTSEVDAEDAFPGMSADPQNFTLLLGLRDGAALRALVDSLIDATAFRVALRSTESHGHKIFNLPLIPQFAVNYAILDDVAVASLSGALVEDVLLRHDDPRAPALATSPTFVEMAGKLRPGYGAFLHQDAAGAMRGLLKTLAALPEHLTRDAEDDEEASPEIELFQDDEADVEADAELNDVLLVAELESGHAPMDLGPFEWLLHLPLPDESVIAKYFHGASVSALRVDEHGLQIESVGP